MLQVKWITTLLCLHLFAATPLKKFDDIDLFLIQFHFLTSKYLTT
jgi:hypothetical protein